MKKIITTLMIGYLIVLVNIDISNVDVFINTFGYGLIAASFYQFNQLESLDLKLAYPVIIPVFMIIGTFVLEPSSAVGTGIWLVVQIIRVLVIFDIFKLLHHRAKAHQYQDLIDGVAKLKQGYKVVFTLYLLTYMIALIVPIGVMGLVVLAFAVVLIIYEVIILFRINKFRTLEGV